MISIFSRLFQPATNAPITERDLSVRVISPSRREMCDGSYALQPGFWRGAIASRRDGRSLGELVLVVPKKGDAPMLERQTFVVDPLALARHESMLGTSDEPGVLELLQKDAEAFAAGHVPGDAVPEDPRETAGIRRWLGYPAP